MGRTDAVVPILKAYTARDDADKLCLLDAMDALGAGHKAHDLYDGGTAEQRRMGAHLMELFADDAHLPWLERAAVDVDATVRKQGLRAIATQKQTPAWEQAMIRLLDAELEDTRTQAVKSLTRRNTDTARAALKAHR